MQHVLVTGGAGFIGSHLTDLLLDRGIQVRVLDNLSTGRLDNLPMDHPRLEFRTGDIRDRAAVDAAMVDIDAVVHLAAVASVQASLDDPVGTHGSNCLGTIHLLEAARQQKVRRFLYASSAAVYGDVAELPVRETSELRPLSPYAIDKLTGEYYLKVIGGMSGMETVAFRFFNIYGPRQDPSSPYSGVISIFATRALAGQQLLVYGDGGQTRDFVYVADLVSILAGSLTATAVPDGPVNVGGGVQYSLLELIAALEQVLGSSIAREHRPPREGDIRHSRADTERLRSFVGSVPSTPLTSGLSILLDSLRGVRP